MDAGLRRICSSGLAAATLGLAGLVLSAGPASASSCPTVAADGTVSPAPALGVDWSGCDLSDANLAGASLSFSDLTGANLTGANLQNAYFESANMQGAVITSANFAGADLNGLASGGVTAGQPATLPANWSLVNGYLVGPYAYLENANLANQDLVNSQLSDADLTGANLSKVDLSSSVLAGANLTGANVSHANLFEDNLLGSAVQGADFTGDTFTGVESGFVAGTAKALPTHWSQVDGYLLGPTANLVSADLQDQDLTGADLQGANLYLAKLSGTNFTDANLYDSYPDGDDMTGAIWANTICPDGSNSDTDGGTCVNNIYDEPPVAKPALTGTQGTGGWYTSAVTVTWNWTDANSTINPAECPATSTSTSQGNPVTLSTTCQNVLNGQTTATEQVKIDTTAPRVSVTGVISGHRYPAGHRPAPACRTTDNLSGVARKAALKVTSHWSHGIGTFTATCAGAVDKAGNNQRTAVHVQYRVK
jgi:uncharacterized protein YjbI with pentapeptide repeats